ncbi:16S rRNA (guanine(527)-N(7))-methyltransferase RsmG [Georgenia yuyongxinii]|uniref:Ribosomal RNA small subunit methyltransferase G n=1 Tax=Georgenia yuyongxinii TaxID=2589797 RepID=A0A5B8C6P1_9MICO|nr:16S rRNA (guanine(527)-N(7))-methyltransferase RsmG [Georgenia yuyongxinii]QDC26409.1 16S rRNA (guanine(527)-N(7))-methyltransferase RsmG [Georgenia yuyongxinii]
MRAYFGIAWAPIEHFAQMLAEEGELRGLIGPRELPRLWARHLVNSAAAAPFLGADAAVADVGSGAGFPGLVLAIVRPDLELHLVEPMERRIAWLSDVVDEIGLDNVILHHARAEELHRRRTFDHVTARAVAALDKLARWTVPLLKSGGTLVALKGQRAADEVATAKYVLRKLGIVEATVHQVQPVEGVEQTTVVVAKRR